MTTLWILGDSFSSAKDADTPIDPRTWMKQLAPRLGVDRVANLSIRGVSQEYTWFRLHEILRDQVEPDDYMVIALTHPARRWYHPKYPEISRYEHVWKFSEIGLKKHHEAAKLYVECIQRQDMDVVQVEERLTWLDSMTDRLGLRRPQVLVAFHQELGYSRTLEHIHISRGDLCSISEKERCFEKGFEHYHSLLTYVDFRYNHLCLSNHLVLTDLLVEAFDKDQPVDISSGPFLDNMLTDESIENAEWCQFEIDPDLLKEWRKKRDEDPDLLRKVRLSALFKGR